MGLEDFQSAYVLMGYEIDMGVWMEHVLQWNLLQGDGEGMRTEAGFGEDFMDFHIYCILFY